VPVFPDVESFAADAVPVFGIIDGVIFQEVLNMLAHLLLIFGFEGEVDGFALVAEGDLGAGFVDRSLKVEVASGGGAGGDDDAVVEAAQRRSGFDVRGDLEAVGRGVEQFGGAESHLDADDGVGAEVVVEFVHDQLGEPFIRSVFVDDALSSFPEFRMEELIPASPGTLRVSFFMFA